MREIPLPKNNFLLKKCDSNSPSFFSMYFGQYTCLKWHKLNRQASGFLDLKNKHILVTGAGKRLGRAISDAFLKLPIRLTAHYYQSEKECKELKKQNVQLMKANTASVSEIKDGIKTAVKNFGPIDILINCASVFYSKKALECEEKHWDQIMDVNLKGYFFMAQQCALSMEKGIIINIADRYATKPIQNYTPYLCAKAGLIYLTKHLALEWAPNIRVNSISPGLVLPPDSMLNETNLRFSQSALMKRWGTPQDIIDGIFFLIQNDYITGFDLKVDGGRSLA